ncbi:MAG: twin-arginine translocation signal domain-containing protein, partial [Verrucomicrobiota bacterium]
MKTPNEPLNRRQLLKSVGALSAMAALDPVRAVAAKSDSLPTQFYKSLSDEQIEKIVLPTKHPKRQYISNWWYIHREHRINEETYTKEQLEMIQTIFDSLHNPEFHDKVNDQVESDLMGDLGNIPAVGFFGTPDDDDFEFIYTGLHTKLHALYKAATHSYRCGACIQVCAY